MTDVGTTSEVPGDVSFGAAVARLRKRAGLTGKELGRRAGMSQAKISRIETGAANVDPDEIPVLVRALRLTADEGQLLLDYAERGTSSLTDWRPTPYRSAERQREFAQLESTTREFRVFQPTVVIGLLQTSEYARAVLSQFNAFAAARIADPRIDVSEAVSVRMQRHGVLVAPRRHFTFLMTEAVLSNRLCGPIDMLGQIDRIREVARLHNVVVGLIPASTNWLIPPYHGFEVLDDRCVLVDLINTTLVSRGRVDVRLYRQVFDALLEQATTEIDPMLDRYFALYLEELRRSRSPN